jgi:copper oxidase (laccase) domain-containing protein
VHAWHEPLPDGRAVELRATARPDGDLAVDGPPAELAARRSAIVDRPWVWLRQVHGRRVVVVADDDDAVDLAGTDADAVVTTRSDIALAVHGADCGIVGLWSPEGVIGAAHAGWKGIDADVLGAVAAEMRALGASAISAVAGPCIGPECYEFGAPALDALAERLGPEVRSTTSWGTPALDLPAAVALSLRQAGVDLVSPPGACTACCVDDQWSFRARGESGRHALLVWLRCDQATR